nr:hypothetical protein Iba_chr13bCG13830 [Ipomoea batatas]
MCSVMCVSRDTAPEQRDLFLGKPATPPAKLCGARRLDYPLSRTDEHHPTRVDSGPRRSHARIERVPNEIQRSVTSHYKELENAAPQRSRLETHDFRIARCLGSEGARRNALSAVTVSLRPSTLLAAAEESVHGTCLDYGHCYASSSAASRKSRSLRADSTPAPRGQGRAPKAAIVLDLPQTGRTVARNAVLSNSDLRTPQEAIVASSSLEATVASLSPEACAVVVVCSPLEVAIVVVISLLEA